MWKRIWPLSRGCTLNKYKKKTRVKLNFNYKIYRWKPFGWHSRNGGERPAILLLFRLSRNRISNRNQILLPRLGEMKTIDSVSPRRWNADRRKSRTHYYFVDGSFIIRLVGPTPTKKSSPSTSSPPNQDDETKEEPIKTPPTHLLHLHIFSIFIPKREMMWDALL